jgi:hypothetical protein
LLHVSEGVVVREHGAEGDDEDLVDGMQDVAGAAAVRDGGEAGAEQFEGTGGGWECGGIG